MSCTPSSRSTLARLVRRAEVRRSAVAALSIAASGPVLAQGPVPQGGEFRVNTVTPRDQFEPAVAMDADGDFVVAWTADDGVLRRGDVRAQRYDATGTPQGAEFRVNAFTTGGQNAPSVAMDADGDFVVTWDSNYQDGSEAGVYARRYAASGAPVGGEFRVNTFTTDRQFAPSVALDADGDFVVAWTSQGQDGSDFGTYAQQYTRSGTAVGSEFRVNTYTPGRQDIPEMAMDADGDFVVTWESFQQDGSRYGVYAQRYSARPVAAEPGAPLGLSLTLAPSPVGLSGGRVHYELPEPQRVHIVVTDVLGREIAVLWDGEQAAGPHEARLDAARLAPGVYVVRLDAGPESVTRRVTVVR